MEQPMTSIPNGGQAPAADSGGQPAPRTMPDVSGGGGWGKPAKQSRPSDFSDRMFSDSGFGDITDDGQGGYEPPEQQPVQRQAQPEDEQPAQDDDPLDQPEQEPQFDEEGNPVDPEAFEAQFAQTMQTIGEAIRKGELPFEALKDLPVTVKVNGQERQVPLAEAVQGYQRNADYTRSKQEAAQLRDQAQNMLQLEKMRNQEWKDPRQLRYGLKQMGLKPAFDQAVRMEVEERVAYLQMSPEARQLHDREQQLSEREQALQMQARQRQQDEQKGQLSERTQYVGKQIEQYMPRALKSVGLSGQPAHQAVFLDNLKILCAEIGEVTPQAARDAAIATREHFQDLAALQMDQGGNAYRQGNPQQRQVAYPNLGPRRMGAGGPPPLQQGQQPASGQRQQSVTSTGQKGLRPSDALQRLGMG